jgi:hypothetical protein
MSEIDWTQQPEKYPLWLEGMNAEQKTHSGWYRESGLVYVGADGGQWRGCREGQFFTVHRRPNQPIWTGEGLPPIGTVCEVVLKSDGYRPDSLKGWETGDKIECIAHVSMQGSNSHSPVFFNKSRSGFSSLRIDCFRPIRTAEQIAAQQREALELAACAEIEPKVDGYNVDLDCSAAIRMTIHAMIEAGYRKVQS